MKLLNADSVGFEFAFRDFKYLSQNISFLHIITDADVLVGNKEATFDIDFKKLVNSDKAGRSMFEVAGRVYFEIAISGWGNYVLNGFFEREGYVEPQRDTTTQPILLFIITPLIAILVFVCLCGYCRKQKKKNMENAKLEELQKK